MKNVCDGFVAEEGCTFVLTEHGYSCTPDDVKPERTIGEPVPLFAEKVPHSWVEKGYVEERPGGKVVKMKPEKTIKDLQSYADASWGDLNETFKAAIAALEKQIPKKPQEIDEREGDGYYYLAFICPSCAEAVIGQPYRPNYCKHCGQALRW